MLFSRIRVGATSTLALIVLSASAVYGQAVAIGSISGTVADQSGSAVPEAVVNMTETERGTVHTTTSSSEGRYTLNNLPAGPYRLEVQAKGFKNFVQTGDCDPGGGQPHAERGTAGRLTDGNGGCRQAPAWWKPGIRPSRRSSNKSGLSIYRWQSHIIVDAGCRHRHHDVERRRSHGQQEHGRIERLRTSWPAARRMA